jgi:putative ABC transport system substrate-binding protein
MKATQQAAQTLGVQLHVLKASTEREIDAAFANFVQQRGNALLVGTDAFFLSRRDQLLALVSRLAIPTMYNLREYVVAAA